MRAWVTVGVLTAALPSTLLGVPAVAAPVSTATRPIVGECYDIPDDRLADVGWWVPATPVPCSQAHTFQVTETGPLPADVDALAFAASACGVLEAWTAVGVNTPMAGVITDPVRVEPRSFAVRQQPGSYVCGAVAVQKNGLAPATAVRLDSPIDRLSRRERAELRHCSSAAEGRRALAPAITVPCSTRPRWQEEARVLWTAFYDEYPGRAALRSRATELCGPGTTISLPRAAAWAATWAGPPPMTSCLRLYP